MIEWKKVSDSLPDNGQECLLYHDVHDHVVGPISFSTQYDGWIDLFATPEAGHIFSAHGDNSPTHWAIWNGPDGE